MRASRSWPRSSVPSGCCQDGPCSMALKSMSLIATGHTMGPSATVSTIAVRMTRLAIASRWRRKRRHASRRRAAGRRSAAPAAVLAVSDARVEEAIKQVRNQVEQDHKAGEDEGHAHDHRRVVGEDGADEERADARDAEDLLGDDGAAEHGGEL